MTIFLLNLTECVIRFELHECGSEEIVFDWRLLPTPAEVLTRIHTFLLNLDANGFERIGNAGSTAKQAVQWKHVTYGRETVDMLVRYDHPTKKELPSDKVSRW